MGEPLPGHRLCRCAKALALLLKGFGARVTVAARKQGDLAFARTLGLQTIPLRQLQEVLPQQEIVFNTIPAPVLTRPLLEQLQPECLIIDLASRPGGVDFEAAGRAGAENHLGALAAGQGGPHHRRPASSATPSCTWLQSLTAAVRPPQSYPNEVKQLSSNSCSNRPVQVGFALTGSFCTFHQVIEQMEAVADHPTGRSSPSSPQRL